MSNFVADIHLEQISTPFCPILTDRVGRICFRFVCISIRFMSFGLEYSVVRRQMFTHQNIFFNTKRFLRFLFSVHKNKGWSSTGRLRRPTHRLEMIQEEFDRMGERECGWEIWDVRERYIDFNSLKCLRSVCPSPYRSTPWQEHFIGNIVPEERTLNDF